MHKQTKQDYKSVLSQGEPRYVAVNFDTYRILQRHRTDSLPQHGFLVYNSDHTNAEITVRWFSRPWHKITAITENHGKSLHGDREYVIILHR